MPSSDEHLNRQLDDLANEASFLNDYSLSDSILSFDFPGSRDHLLSNQEETISDSAVNAPGTKNYLKCILNRKPKETDPLLPVHSPSASLSPVPSIHGPSSPFQVYLEMFLKFFWNYILPERFRVFLTTYQRVIMLIVMAILVIIGGILYATGNFDNCNENSILPDND